MKETTVEDNKKEERVAILAARSKVYEILARAFRYPWEDKYFNPEELLAPFNIILQDESAWEKVEGHIASIKEELSALDRESLRREYVMVFSHGFSKECPPYEILYGSEGYTQQIEVLMELGEIYRRYGVELSEAADERMDHISIELEFMQYLTYKEAYGIRYGHKEEALEVVRVGQKKFITSHLGRWVPLFCQFLSHKAGSGLYHHLAELLSLFMVNEVSLLGVRPKVVEPPEFHPIPYPYKDNSSITDSCESCFVAGDDAIKEIKKIV